MTKHTDEFLHFTEPVTCREHTLPRDDKSADQKGWIQGNTKIGPVCGEKEEIEERTKFDRDTLHQEKHNEVTDPTSTVRPVCGHESTKRCVLSPKHFEDDQTGTGEIRVGASERGVEN